MGLFWSLIPEGGYESGRRMRKKDISRPHRMSIAVLDGHTTPDLAQLQELLQRLKAEPEGNLTGLSCLSARLVERHYIGRSVQKVPIRHGRLRGTIFLPSGT